MAPVVMQPAPRDFCVRAPDSPLRLNTSSAPETNAVAYTLAPSGETARPSGALNARPSEQPTASTLMTQAEVPVSWVSWPVVAVRVNAVTLLLRSDVT